MTAGSTSPPPADADGSARVIADGLSAGVECSASRCGDGLRRPRVARGLGVRRARPAAGSPVRQRTGLRMARPLVGGRRSPRRRARIGLGLVRGARARSVVAPAVREQAAAPRAGVVAGDDAFVRVVDFSAQANERDKLPMVAERVRHRTRSVRSTLGVWCARRRPRRMLPFGTCVDGVCVLDRVVRAARPSTPGRQTVVDRHHHRWPGSRVGSDDARCALPEPHAVDRLGLLDGCSAGLSPRPNVANRSDA